MDITVSKFFFLFYYFLIPLMALVVHIKDTFSIETD